MTFGEAGGGYVRKLVPTSAVSAVNWSEFVQKCEQKGADVPAAIESLEDLGLSVVDLSRIDAEAAARLWQSTKSLGLSLADRACLALAARLGAKVATMDCALARAEVGVAVEVLRPPAG
jgi:PIN domain nuclease of toxin-antitoxin system